MARPRAQAGTPRPRWWLVAALLAIVVPACSEPTSAPTDQRPFDVFVPTSYDDSTPAPLVILLHGYSLSGDEIEFLFRLQPAAEARGFLYVHPDGTENAEGERFWNATDGCCNPDHLPVDDSAYLSAVIDQVGARYNVDRRRVYVVGVSNGGFMSYRMACDHADQIAAIVSLGGATFLDPTRCAPSEPVSVLQIHGTDDRIIPYGGGTFIDDPFPSAPTTVATWAAYDGCVPAREPTDLRLDLAAAVPGAETEVSRFDGCRDGTAVELWTVTGADHIFELTPEFVPRVVDFLFAHPKP